MNAKSPSRLVEPTGPHRPFLVTHSNLVPCIQCEGSGEIGTRQDYFGNWDTEQCRCCQGEGEITPERADEWRDLLETDFT